jgi:hypothetical protein
VALWHHGRPRRPKRRGWPINSRLTHSADFIISAPPRKIQELICTMKESEIFLANPVANV